MVAGFDPCATPPQVAVGSDPGRAGCRRRRLCGLHRRRRRGLAHLRLQPRHAAGVPDLHGRRRRRAIPPSAATSSSGRTTATATGISTAATWTALRLPVPACGERCSCRQCVAASCPPSSPSARAAGNQTTPPIYGDIVVWQDDRNGNCGHLRLRPLPARRPGRRAAASTAPPRRWLRRARPSLPSAPASGDQTNPTISGSLVAWQDDRNGTSHIYGYDLDSQTEFPICTATGDQTCPSAGGGDTVVWLDGRNGGSDVYGATVSFGDAVAADRGVDLEQRRQPAALGLPGPRRLRRVELLARRRRRPGPRDGWLTLDQSSTIQLPAGDGPKTVYLSSPTAPAAP